MRLEKSGKLEAAAALYRKIVDKDPLSQEAVGRLLVVYRKLKSYREELAVINRVLAAYQEQDKDRQRKWVREHSKAAAAGTAVFQQLGGGASVSSFAADPVVGTLVRRKEVVERRIPGKKGGERGGKAKAGQRKGGAEDRKTARERMNQENRERRGAEMAARKEEKARRREEAARRKEETARRKAEAAQRKVEAAQRKVEAAEKKAMEADARKAEQEERRPSLFVITLSYRVPLKKIDAAMAAHVAFLNKQYKKGTLMASGRQVPRVGGIVVAKGKDRGAVERMMQADPLVKKGLATIEVVEFKPSRTAKELARWVARTVR